MVRPLFVTFIVFLSVFLFCLFLYPGFGDGIPEDVVVDDDLVDIQIVYPDWLEDFPGAGLFAARSEELAASVASYAGEQAAEFPDSALLPYVLKVDFERFVVGDFVSGVMTSYMYTGGAHGNTSFFL